MLLTGGAFTGFLVSLRALAADIADEIRLETGREWMGLVFALMNATTKVAGAAGVFFTFRVLSRIGFDPHAGAVNTEAALRGLERAFFAGPIVFVMTGGLVFLGYRLDHRRHADIRRQLEALKVAGKPAEPPPKAEAKPETAMGPGLEPAEPGRYTVTADGILRATPANGGARVGRVARGAAVQVLGRVPEGGWYRIALEDGTQGFVAAALLKHEPPPAPAPAPSQAEYHRRCRA